MASDCAVQPNPDLYGLGIRLGIYLSWAASSLASIANLKDSVEEIYDSAIVFNGAIAVAILYLTSATPAKAHLIEMIIMLYLFMGNYLCIAASSDSRQRSWTSILRRSLWIGMPIYSLWFWTAGVYSDAFDGTTPECRPIVFLLARLQGSQFPAFRIVLIVSSSLLLAVTILSAPGLLLDEILSARAITHSVVDFTNQTVGDDDIKDHGERLIVRIWRIEGWLARQLFGAFFISGVELMLRWNNITGVYTLRSVGQLVPFTVGIVGLAKVCHEVLLTILGKRSATGTRHTVTQLNHAIPSTATDDSERPAESQSNDRTNGVGDKTRLLPRDPRYEGWQY